MCKRYMVRALILFLGIQSAQVWAGWRLENARAITTKEDGWFTAPKWSPDGKKIVFTKAKKRGIYVKNADGTGKISKYEELSGNFNWSLDGKEMVYLKNNKLIFVSLDNGKIEREELVPFKIKPTTVLSFSYLSTSEIWYSIVERSNIEAEKHKFSIIVCDSMGKINRRVETDIWGQGVPSPDGRKIAYCEPHVRGKLVTPDITRLWITDMNGKNKKLLLKGGYILSPHWSPDGGKIVVTVGGRPHMVVFDMETGIKIDLGRGDQICWSPDSRWLLYNIMEDDGHYVTASDIFLIKWDGTEKSRLTETKDLIEVKPCFSPDGKKAAFSTEDGRLFVADLIKEETK